MIGWGRGPLSQADNRTYITELPCVKWVIVSKARSTWHLSLRKCYLLLLFSSTHSPGQDVCPPFMIPYISVPGIPALQYILRSLYYFLWLIFKYWSSHSYLKAHFYLPRSLGNRHHPMNTFGKSDFLLHYKDGGSPNTGAGSQPHVWCGPSARCGRGPVLPSCPGLSPSALFPRQSQWSHHFSVTRPSHPCLPPRPAHPSYLVLEHTPRGPVRPQCINAHSQPPAEPHRGPREQAVFSSSTAQHLAGV